MKQRQAVCFLAAVLVCLVLGRWTAAFGQKSSAKGSIIGTAHDIAALGGGCRSCHVSHNAPKGLVLGWAPAFSTTVFGVYDSVTLDSKATETGSAAYSNSNRPAGAKVHSLLCMSCHDGVTTPGVIGPSHAAATGNPAVSAGLTNDHPVNMAFDPDLDGGLKTIASVAATNVRLFDEGGQMTVQCASCHDPHNGPGLSNFLRVSNAGSRLCTTCHL